MSRVALIERAYSRREQLSCEFDDYKKQVLALFEFLVKQDVNGDDLTTSSVIIGDVRSEALLVVKDAGIICGLEEVKVFLESKGLIVELLKKDGDEVHSGDHVVKLVGDAYLLLSLERTVLNVVSRMSGIATVTRRAVEKLESFGSSCKVAATRKTLLGSLDHKAVTVGGGLSHRLGLYDAILIKNNHISCVSHLPSFSDKEDSEIIDKLIHRAWEKHDVSQFVEVETRTSFEAVSAAETLIHLRERDKALADEEEYPIIIMLDNFSSTEISSTIYTLKNQLLYDKILIEVSGGVTVDNVDQFAVEGVDVISMGSLTHSVKGLDVSLHLR